VIYHIFDTTHHDSGRKGKGKEKMWSRITFLSKCAQKKVMTQIITNMGRTLHVLYQSALSRYCLNYLFHSIMFPVETTKTIKFVTIRTECFYFLCSRITCFLSQECKLTSISNCKFLCLCVSSIYFESLTQVCPERRNNEEENTENKKERMYTQQPNTEMYTCIYMWKERKIP
jgi:hypothetical protein